jgi:hypothetical protein
MKTMLMIIALLLLASSAQAAPVDLTQGSGIVSQVNVYLERMGSQVLQLIVLSGDGRMYKLWPGSSTGDYQFAWAPLLGSWPETVPVPVSEIADWTPMSVILHSGVVYCWSATAREWLKVGDLGEIPPLPGFTPVASESSSLGGLKSQYR